MKHPNHGTVIAVMVSYHPDAALLSRIEAVLAQVDALVLVDNSGGAADSLLNQLPAQVNTIRNPENRGLAVAQNQGITEARVRGAAWVLLLDDDSTPAPDMVTQLFAHITANIGILAPTILDEKTHRPAVRHAQHPLLVIASGSLIPVTVFDAVGMMEEAWNIDCIDWDFCARVQLAGLRITQVKSAVLYHTLGTPMQRFGITSTGHSIERRTIAARNRVWFWRRYLWRFPRIVLYTFGASLWDYTRMLVVEPSRKEKLRAILRGIREGIHHANSH